MPAATEPKAHKELLAATEPKAHKELLAATEPKAHKELLAATEPKARLAQQVLAIKLYSLFKGHK
jgi:hypothetical protein